MVKDPHHSNSDRSLLRKLLLLKCSLVLITYDNKSNISNDATIITTTITILRLPIIIFTMKLTTYKGGRDLKYIYSQMED